MVNQAAQKLVPKTSFGPFSLKGLKTLRGDETPCYEATLLEDGKPVAFVHNEGHGGQSYVDPPLKSTDEQYRAFRQAHDALIQRMNDVAAKEMEPLDMGEGEPPLPCDWDTMLMTMVENHGMLKSLKAHVKKGKTVLGNPADPDGFEILAGSPAEPRVQKYVAEKMPDFVILNEAITGLGA